MAGGAFTGGVDIRNGCSKYMHLEPGDSIWDECGLHRLSRCPFCGEYPDWMYVENEDEGMQWMVHCTERSCHVKPSTSWTDEVEFAALKWNRRFTPGHRKKRVP